MNMPLSDIHACRYNYKSKAKPFCPCWHTKEGGTGHSSSNPDVCRCDEDFDIKEWRWAEPCDAQYNRVVLSDNNHSVTLHPSAITLQHTAFVCGDTPLKQNYHYYWEVKLLTKPFGTDIMVGVGTNKFDPSKYNNRQVSLLGINKQSYGLSFTGAAQHNEMFVTRETQRFRDGSVIGIRLNMWQGTLDFFVNRKCQGTTFYNLRRHKAALYPMLSSATFQTTFKLVYAASWEASLFADSLRVLAPSRKNQIVLSSLPQGLQTLLKRYFWMNLTEVDESPVKRSIYATKIKCKRLQKTSSQRYSAAFLKRAFLSNLELI